LCDLHHELKRRRNTTRHVVPGRSSGVEWHDPHLENRAGWAETTLRFTHGGWKAMTPFYASCNSMWGQLMFRLKGFVEGRNPGPQWTE